MPNLILALYLLQGLNNFISAQSSAPWRNRIQWVNNGQMFSLMSTGSEYHAPVVSRRQSRVYMSSSRDAARDRAMRIRVEAVERPTSSVPDSSTALLGPDRMQYIVANSRAPGARQMQVRQRLRGPPGTRANSTVLSEYSGGGRTPAQGGNNARRAPAVANLQQLTAPTDNSNTLSSDHGNYNEAALPRAQAPNVPVDQGTTSESMAGDDPRNRNTVFYNIYPPGGRTLIPRRPPPGTGYGTRYFQNGELCVKHEFNLNICGNVRYLFKRRVFSMIVLCRSSGPCARSIFHPGGIIHPARPDVRAPMRGGGELSGAVRKYRFSYELLSV